MRLQYWSSSKQVSVILCVCTSMCFADCRKVSATVSRERMTQCFVLGCVSRDGFQYAYCPKKKKFVWKKAFLKMIIVAFWGVIFSHPSSMVPGLLMSLCGNCVQECMIPTTIFNEPFTPFVNATVRLIFVIFSYFSWQILDRLLSNSEHTSMCFL